MMIEHSAKNNVSSLDLSSGVHISGLDHGGLVNIDNREEEGNSDESDRLERNSNDPVLGRHDDGDQLIDAAIVQHSQVNGLKIAVPNRPASSATQKRYAVENAAQHSLEQENREEGNRQEKYEQELGEERVNDKDYARSLGLLIKQEMEAIYSELPLTFLFERQLSGLFALRFRRVMKHMLTRWMHGYYIEAIRRWRAFLAADYSARRVEAAILVQKTRRGHLARRRVQKLVYQLCGVSIYP